MGRHSKEYLEKNRDKILAYHREYNKKYLEKNKEAINAKRRVRYAANKDAENERSREYYKKNRDKWFAKNKQNKRWNNVNDYDQVTDDELQRLVAKQFE